MTSSIDMNAASTIKSAYATLAAQKEAAGTKNLNAPKEKARQAAEDFEAVYLNTMFSQMFTGIDGDGPFGGGQALGVWRSFLTDEYAKSFAKQGGIGIASEVYKTLLAHQEARGDITPAATEPKS